MRPNKYPFLVLAAALFCACSQQARKTPPTAGPAREIPQTAVPDKKEAAPAKKEVVAVKLSPEDAQKVDSLYYKAVGAYSNNDMGAALKYLDELSAIHPAYPPAAELREKIRSVSRSR